MRVTFLVQNRVRGIDGRWGLWQTVISTPNSITASNVLVEYARDNANDHFSQYRIDVDVTTTDVP